MQIIRHRAFADQVAAADLDAVDADMRGDRIHQPLAHEGGLIAPRRAIGAARRLVGQADMADGAIGRHAIGPRQHGCGQIGHGRRVRAHIGAVIVKEFVVDREDAAVGIDGGADVMLLLARMVGGDQVLAAVLDPFDGLLEGESGGADQHVFRIDFAADAEAASNMAFIEMHIVARAADHLRDVVAVPPRHLGGAVHFQNIAAFVVTGDGATRFHRHAGMAAGRQRERNDRVRRLERRLDVAITFADHARLCGVRAVEWAGCAGGIEHRRERLDIQFDQVCGVLGDILIGREHHDDWLADIAHIILCQHGLAIGFKLLQPGEAKRDRRDVGDIFMGPHRMHAGPCQRGAGVDAAKFSVRHG